MDPIFDRLGRLIRSFGADGTSKPTRSSDSLEQEAEDELEEILRTGRDAPKRPTQGQKAYQETRREAREPTPSAPEPILRAYATLGLAPSATWDQVSAAHRSLLKKHHPDRHAGNEALLRQATTQSQQINEAFQVLKKHLGH